MTAPLPPTMKACLAIERALEPLNDDERAEAISLCFPPGTPLQVARLQMALEACAAVVRTRATKGEWPAWCVRDIIDKALYP